MQWQDRFGFFAKRTTLHGFLELHESNSWWEKCLWTIIMGTCTGMLVWFIEIQTTQYLKGPTATRITPLGGRPAFPPIWLGHAIASSIDAEKLRQFGLTTEEMHLAMGYLHGNLVYNSTIPMEKAKKSLWEKLRQQNISQIMQFFHHVALDVFDGSDAKDLALERRATINATSYLINTTASGKMMLVSDVWNFYFHFHFTTFWENARQLMPLLPNGSIGHDPTMLRPVITNPDTFIRVRLEPEFHTIITTESTIYRRLGRCTNEHPIHEWYSRELCELDCELRANSSIHAATCVEYMFGQEYTKSFLDGRVSLCHRGMKNATTGQLEGKEDPVFRDLDSHERDARDREIATCQKECIPRCDQWRTTWSITSLKMDFVQPEMALVSLAFLDSSSLFVFEEVRQYEWHDLVSDFGGLLGLWLGASMISVFQLIQLCFFPKGKIKKQPDVDQIVNKKFEDLWLEFSARATQKFEDLWVETVKRTQTEYSVGIPRSRRCKRSKTVPSI